MDMREPAMVSENWTLRQENMDLRDTNLRLRITIDFLNGLTFLGLARKYGMPTKEIEQIVREMTKR